MILHSMGAYSEIPVPVETPFGEIETYPGKPLLNILDYIEWSEKQQGTWNYFGDFNDFDYDYQNIPWYAFPWTEFYLY